jgi:hypothetical protein
MRERRGATAVALRELRVELKLRRAELASLERAEDILERSIEEQADRCDSYHPDAPCEGVFSARWCRRCGIVVRHCEAHGGIRAATHRLDMHHADEHGGSDVRDPSTEDARGVPGRSAAVPVGGLSSPPVARGSEDATDGEGVASDVAAAEPSDAGSNVGRPSTGPSVIRRSRNREGVELLSYMPYTCSLDVVDAFPDGLSPRRVGWLLAVTEQAIDAEGRKPHVQEALEALKEFMLR